MRCQFFTEDGYTKRIQNAENLCDKERCLAIFSKHLTKKNRVNDSVLINSFTLGKLEQITYRYGRGDSLDSIRSEVIYPALDAFKFAFETLDEHIDLDTYYLNGQYIEYYKARVIYATDIVEMFALVCWFYAYGATDDNRFKRVCSRLCPTGISLPADTVLSIFNSERTIKSNNPRLKDSEFLQFWEHFFEKLDNRDECSTLLLSYLNDWARLLTLHLKETETLYSFVVEIEGAMPQSNERLDEHRKKEDTLKGFWAWEVALMVMLYDLDDSSFRDHFLYPVDLVDYYRSNTG